MQQEKTRTLARLKAKVLTKKEVEIISGGIKEERCKVTSTGPSRTVYTLNSDVRTDIQLGDVSC